LEADELDQSSYGEDEIEEETGLSWKDQ